MPQAIHFVAHCKLNVSISKTPTSQCHLTITFSANLDPSQVHEKVEYP